MNNETEINEPELNDEQTAAEHEHDCGCGGRGHGPGMGRGRGKGRGRGRGMGRGRGRHEDRRARRQLMFRALRAGHGYTELEPGDLEALKEHQRDLEQRLADLTDLIGKLES